MPTYDFVCARRHTTEATTARDVEAVLCGRASCMLTARRSAVPARVGLGGMVTTPMDQRRIPLSLAQEAHDTIVDQASRAGVRPPDTFRAAKARGRAIRRHRPDLIGGGS